MTCRKNNATGGIFQRNSHLYGWRSRKPEVDHVDTQTLQGTANEAIDHTTGYPCVTADNDLVFSCFANSPGTIGRSKFYDIKRCKSLSCRTTDSAAYAGYRFDECQSVAILAHKIINNWLANAQNRSPTVHIGNATYDNRKSVAIVLSVQLT